jgi:hypothetical protein
VGEGDSFIFYQEDLTFLQNRAIVLGTVQKTHGAFFCFMEKKQVNKLAKSHVSGVSVTIRVGEHSMDTSPLAAMENALAHVFRLGGITGEITAKLGPYIQQAKRPGIRVISVDARSVSVSVQVMEYHRFHYKLFVDRPPHILSNFEFAALIQKGINKLEKNGNRTFRRRSLAQLVQEARSSISVEVDDEGNPSTEKESEELTEQGFQLALLREEHDKDVSSLRETETLLSQVEKQIKDEKNEIPRDQEVLHKLSVRKSQLTASLIPIRRRLHVQEVEIRRLEHALHLDRTREERFAEAEAKVRAVLTHDELPAFLDHLRGR